MNESKTVIFAPEENKMTSDIEVIESEINKISLKKISLKKGDILVVEVYKEYSEKELEYLKEYFNSIVPRGCKVVITKNGIVNFSVIET